jgi:Rrf2 family protein
MLGLSKRTEYALIALGYLVERPDNCCPAREIAGAYNLPQALLMNLLKEMHQAGFLSSTRGTKGGYRIAVDLGETSLHDLIKVIDGPIELVECVNENKSCDQSNCCRISAMCPIQVPLQALHQKLIRFLKDVKISDLIVPGRRIDVSVDQIRMGSEAGASI